MRDRQTCIDCGKVSPETETNYTLISAQFGWRLSRRRNASGDFVVEWRCAECWRDHKKKTMGDEAGAASSQPKPADRARGAAIPKSSTTLVSRTGSSSRPPPRASSKPPSAGTPLAKPKRP